jgi:hypothetical protein
MSLKELVVERVLAHLVRARARVRVRVRARAMDRVRVRARVGRSPELVVER